MHHPTPEQATRAQQTARSLIGLLGSFVRQAPLEDALPELIAAESASWWSNVASATCGILLVALDEPELQGKLSSKIILAELTQTASIPLDLKEPQDKRVSDLVEARSTDPSVEAILQNLSIAAALIQAIARTVDLSPDVVIVRTAVDAAAYAVAEPYL